MGNGSWVNLLVVVHHEYYWLWQALANGLEETQGKGVDSGHEFGCEQRNGFAFSGGGPFDSQTQIVK
jgi:hypothetical protein